MKKIVFICLFLGINIWLNGQTQHKYDGIWWDIADKCFKEAQLQEHNTLFIEIDNDHTAGSVYKKRINNTGRMLHPIIVNDCEQVAAKLTGYPKAIEKKYSNTSVFNLENQKTYQENVVGKILQSAALEKISPELYAILKKSTALSLKINDWGTEEMDRTALENSIKENKKTDFVKAMRDGDRYVVVKAVWFKSLSITYTITNENAVKIEDILKEHGEDLKRKGITLVNNNEIIIDYGKKMYPFLVFGEIAANITLNKEIIFEPDFKSYNNLKRFE